MAKKILIVDDSALMRRVACDIITSDSRFEVADVARNGLDALELLKTKSYDAVVLDVNMPRMNGLELLRELQKLNIKTKTLMFSTQTADGTRETLEALELGAMDFIQKPQGVLGVSEEKFKQEFLNLLSVISGAGRAYSSFGVSSDRIQGDRNLGDRNLGDRKPGDRDPGDRSQGDRSAADPASAVDMARAAREAARATSESLKKMSFTRLSSMPNKTVKLKAPERILGEKLVAIASSTGGPKALQQFIPKLPANLNAPVLLVQHMPPGFTKSLAERLDDLSPLHVKEAEEGDKLEKGWVYVAAGGKHMKVSKSGSNYRIYYTDEPNREGVKPCANYMYESLVDSDFAQICCVVMTGMGADGTEGIRNLNDKKKIHVIAQSEETCAVYGMPKNIALTGLTNELIPLEQLSEQVVKIVGTR